MAQDIEFDVPGTVRVAKRESPADLILLPRPSQDPNDPLNWSKWRKYWHIFVVLFWCFWINAAIAWTGPAWAVWVEDLNCTYTDLNNGSGVLIFLCSFGILFLHPWALKYGRRLPYIVASALVMIGLGLGYSMTSVGLFFAYTTLGGLGSGPAFSTNETSIVDVMFQHQRATWLGVYSLVLMLGNFLPPVAAGYIIDSQGWHWCFTYLMIFLGLASLLLFVAGEETLYVRSERDMVPAVVEQTEGRRSNSHAHATEAKAQAFAGRPRSEHRVSLTYEMSTYRQRMTLFKRDTSIKTSYLGLILSPFRLMMLPAVVWAGVMVSLGAFMTAIVFTTQASFFSVEPYNFSAQKLGLMYFAIIIGLFIGSAWGGPFGDWLVLRLARQNGGILEPEQRLWAYHPISIASAGGVILYGVGASYGVHWIVPCIGLALIGFSMNAAIPIAMGYALDCYDDLSGEIVQLTNFLRNAIAGALTFIIQPWVIHNGARDTSIIIGLLILAINLTTVAFQIWGKKFRAGSAARYRKFTEKEMYF